jgi:hypothetical protein
VLAGWGKEWVGSTLGALSVRQANRATPKGLIISVSVYDSQLRLSVREPAPNARLVVSAIPVIRAGVHPPYHGQAIDYSAQAARPGSKSGGRQPGCSRECIPRLRSPVAEEAA